jgi:uncharacterized protein YkwD
MLTKQLLILAFYLVLGTNPVAETGSNYTKEQAEEMVSRHNEYRKAVGVSDLKWSNEVATYAQNWANHLAENGCDLEHRSNNKYGENISWSYGRDPAPTQISDDWASEKKYWKGGKITMRNFSKVGHYTQMIWFASTEIGCGQATCSDGSIIVVCNYNPPGNMIGQSPEGK